MLHAYATFLGREIFDELVADYAQTLTQQGVPPARLYKDGTALHGLPADGMREALTALQDGLAFERAVERLRDWEKEPSAGRVRQDVVPAEAVRAYAAEREVLLRFLPRFTTDPTASAELGAALTKHYSHLSDLAFQTISRIQLETVNARLTATGYLHQESSVQAHVATAELTVLYRELQAQNEEINAYNEELRRLKIEADAANRLKSEFLANMSHELRTPMNSIIGFTELVLSQKSAKIDPRSREDLAVVLRNAQALLALINDILDLSKIEAGKTAIFATPVDLGEALATVLSNLDPMAAERSLTLRLEVAAGLPRVLTDETKLRQIILNLVGNAVKFSQDGQIGVRAWSLGDRFAISVTDTGLGIAPEHHDLVFEEFRQVDASNTREAGGTGLGLAIARRMARLMGGDVTLESTLGQGSTFTLELPYEQEEAVVVPVVLRPRPADQLMDGKHVIVSIDDDPEVLRLISEKLAGSPYTVVPATSGESGIQLAKALRPFAITLDVLMPKMDGWTVLQALKHDPETTDIPVVMLSCIENKVLGISLGASAYLPKPINAAALIESFERFKPLLNDRPGYALVVDDDPDTRNLYRRLLDDQGVRVVEAVDGVEAIAAIKQELPSFMLLDLMMPRMDGFEVMAWIRSQLNTLELPVVILTAKDVSDEELDRLADVRQVILKRNVTEAVLVEDLRDLLDRYRADAEEQP